MTHRFSIPTSCDRQLHRPRSLLAWTRVGGIVWMGVAIWLLILLGTYAVTTGGIVPASHSGIAYDLPAHRIRALDIQRLLVHQPVRDVEGQIVIDPSSDSIQVVAVGQSGRVAVKFASVPDRSVRQTVVVLIPDPDASYEDVVTAMDQLRSQNSSVPLKTWIAAPLAVEPDV